MYCLQDVGITFGAWRVDWVSLTSSGIFWMVGCGDTRGNFALYILDRKSTVEIGIMGVVWIRRIRRHLSVLFPWGRLTKRWGLLAWRQTVVMGVAALK